MEIVQARTEDIPEILELVQDVIKDMSANAITQWNDLYPPLEIFGDDVEKNSLYTMKKDNIIIGIIALSDEQDKEYKDVEWTDKHGKFLVVHRLAVHPIWQRMGIANKLMEFAEQYAIKNGFTSIRIDTFSRNPRMLALIEKRSYDRKTGQIFFPENVEPYYCYEHVLKKNS